MQDYKPPAVLDNNSNMIFDFIELGKIAHEEPPMAYLDLISDLKEKILHHGFTQEDRRLNRTVQALAGDFLVIKDPIVLAYLQSTKPIEKYRDDWYRMLTSFLDATIEAKKDLNSRQLVISNMYDFKNVKQCFNLFQFVYTRRNEFDLYVYQRSADMVKLKDDLTFFGNVAGAFEEVVGQKVTKIVVTYGHVHYTKE